MDVSTGAGLGVQGLLRHRHARWRLLLWRSLLGFGVLLPLLAWLPVPGVRIPLATQDNAPAELVGGMNRDATQGSVQPAVATATVAPGLDAPIASARPAAPVPLPIPGRPVSWGSLVVAVWVLGMVLGAARLLRWQGELARLRRSAGPPAPELHQLARHIQTRLGVAGEVAVKVSEAVGSPFVCGMRRPMVLLPRNLVATLEPGEVAALLSHELAHLRRHDLAWCVAWRWMQVVCWWHPLVWRIPSAHNLACEQEADRVAAGQLTDEEAYPRLLARLALRVLALPVVETQLTANGSSQIARRLRHLAQPGVGAWSWRHTVAGFSLAAGVFLVTAGCQFTQGGSATAKTPPVAFKEMRVVVQDETGQPIAGATVLPDGFRVKGPRWVDGNGWRKDVFGPPIPATTDKDGIAWVKYPVMGIPEEKELTGGLVFSVSHPEYGTVRIQEYHVTACPLPPNRGTTIIIPWN